VGILSLSVLLALSLTDTAFAGGGGGVGVQATDPSAGTPAGVVYSIPLDSARQDASPHGHNGSGAGGGGGSSSGSGGGGGIVGGGGSGGSSGGGTGATGGGGSAGGGSAGGGSASGGSAGSGSGSGAGGSAGSSSVKLAKVAPVLIPGGQPGSLVNSANGFGSSPGIPSLNAPAAAGLGSVQSNASSAPVLAILLAALVLVLGGYIGIRSWRGPRRAQLVEPKEPPQLPAGTP
jgi:hypothetical protein